MTMKPILLTSSSFMLVLLLGEGGGSINPVGSTGCSTVWTQENGRCWRYCSGSDGDWCYTGSNCTGNATTGTTGSQDQSCATKVSCSDSGCEGAARGCVNTCPDRNSTISPPPVVPHGSTGCSNIWTRENGRCWRYCSGSSGLWCYTASSCIGNEETCAWRTSCGGFSCWSAAVGCVVSCPPELDQCEALQRKVTASTALVTNFTDSGSGCDVLKARYEGDYDSETEPFPQPSSINKYWYKKGRGQVRIPTMVRATFSRTCRFWTYVEDFEGAFENVLNATDRREEDEQEQLVGGSLLCGLSKWYNLAPQSPGSRARLGWNTVEAGLGRYVDAGCGRMELWTIVDYRGDADDEDDEAYRPLGFKVCAKLMLRDGTQIGPELAYYFDNE